MTLEKECSNYYYYYLFIFFEVFRIIVAQNYVLEGRIFLLPSKALVAEDTPREDDPNIAPGQNLPLGNWTPYTYRLALFAVRKLK